MEHSYHLSQLEKMPAAEALPHYLDLLDIQPQKADIYVKTMDCLIKCKAKDEALELASHAHTFADRSSSSAPIVAAINCYMHYGHYAQASILATAGYHNIWGDPALLDEEEGLKLYRAMAGAFNKASDKTRFNNVLNVITDRYTYNATAQSYAAMMHFVTGQHEPALDLARSSIRLFPDSRDVMHAALRIFTHHSLIDEAAPVFKKLGTECRGDNTIEVYLQAAQHFGFEVPADTIHSFMQRKNVSGKRLSHALASFYVHPLGQPETAKQIIEQATKYNSKDVNWMLHSLRIARMINDPNWAAGYCLLASKELLNEHQIHAAIAQTMLYFGDVQGAKQYCANALAMRSNGKSAHGVQAGIALYEGDVAEYRRIVVNINRQHHGPMDKRFMRLEGIYAWLYEEDNARAANCFSQCDGQPLDHALLLAVTDPYQHDAHAKLQASMSPWLFKQVNNLAERLKARDFNLVDIALQLPIGGLPYVRDYKSQYQSTDMLAAMRTCYKSSGWPASPSVGVSGRSRFPLGGNRALSRPS